jgi:hypothetical protein
MKYYKSYEAYSGIKNEDWNMKNSLIGKMFSGIFNGVSNSVKKLKLRNLGNQLDKYLEAVYKIYVDKKYDKELEDIEDVDFEFVDPSNFKKPINDVDNSSDISFGKKEVVPVEPKGMDPEVKEEIEEERGNGLETGSVVNFDGDDTSSEEPDDITPKDSELNTNVIDDINKQKEIIDEIEERLSELDKQQDVDYDRMKYGGTDKTKEEAEDRIKLRTKEIDRVMHDREIAEQELKDMINKAGLNESSMDWASTEIVNPDWTHDDVDNITDIVNPYQIEEIFLKANNIISSGSDNSKDKLQYLWNLALNDVYKKWFYVFDTTKLQDKTAPFQLDRKKSKSLPSKKKDSLIATQSLEELYKNDIESYTSPKFYGLDKDSSDWFVLNLGLDRMFLVKKELIEKNKYVLKIIGELIINDKNELSIINDYRDINSITVDGKDLDLYKEGNNYPYIILSGDKVYSPVNWNKAKIGDYSISSISDSLLRRIMKNSPKGYRKDSDVQMENDKLSEIKNKKLL